MKNTTIAFRINDSDKKILKAKALKNNRTLSNYIIDKISKDDRE